MMKFSFNFWNMLKTKGLKAKMAADLAGFTMKTSNRPPEMGKCHFCKQNTNRKSSYRPRKATDCCVNTRIQQMPELCSTDFYCNIYRE